MRIKIFFSYAHEDQKDVEALKSHLNLWKNIGLIEMWYDRDIRAGEPWKQKITDQLNAAHIILLLVSPDFMSSDYCYSTEMKRAMERHEHKEARVIPIILRPTHYRDASFGGLQVLPPKGKPVSKWRSKDDAFYEVAGNIRTVIDELTTEMLKSKLGSHSIKSDQTQTTKSSVGTQASGIESSQPITDPKDIIVQVLSIVEYEDDKNEYAHEFIDLAEKQALLDVLMALPLKEQEAFKQQMSQAKGTEEVKAIIKHYVTPESYTSALKTASMNAFTKFITALLPELEDEQIDRLQTYLLSIALINIDSLTPLPIPDPSQVPTSVGFLYLGEEVEPKQVYQLDKGILRIGRAKTNDIILEDSTVSRLHVTLFNMGDGNYTLRDEGSLHGTRVNGYTVEKHQLYTLRDGDAIQFGQVQVNFTNYNSRDLPVNILENERALFSFVEDIMRQRGDVVITPESRDSIVEDLYDAVNTHLDSLLSDKDQEELDKLLDREPTDRELSRFFMKKIPNLHSEIIRACLNFKYASNSTQKLARL